jgi:hypothetical protein
MFKEKKDFIKITAKEMVKLNHEYEEMSHQNKFFSENIRNSLQQKSDKLKHRNSSLSKQFNIIRKK